MEGLCESLVHEHEVIERVLDAIEAAARQIRAGGPVDRLFFSEAVTFLREFADGVHHRKEEDILFPGLCAAGIPKDGGPVGVMLHEHNLGRGHIGAIVESLDAAVRGDRAARETLVEESLGYVELLRAHIQKENLILFPMAEQVLGYDQKSQIYRAFQQAEAATTDLTNRQRQWAEGLSSRSLES
ncbi:MAG: hemerythrin domain-containing protein [candidate division Zixibacteria bacterium]|nr:hemerythrin domain-containing protein [candidate division Zixibacteria bacterium]